MAILGTIVLVAATAAGAFASLGLFVLVMASLANATEAQVAAGKRWMLAIALGGAATVAAAVWLGVRGRPWLGSLVGVLPGVGMIGLFVWLEVSRWFPRRGACCKRSSTPSSRDSGW